MNMFSRKEDKLLDERIRLTRIYIDQQKDENSDLRKELAELTELSLRNRLMLDDQLNSVAANEKIIHSIKDHNKALESNIKSNDEIINKLEDEISQLKGVKSTYLPTDFLLSSTNSEALQDILNKSIEMSESICFKDLNGNIWQIVKKDQNEEIDSQEYLEDEECTQINEISIEINLS